MKDDRQAHLQSALTRELRAMILIQVLGWAGQVTSEAAPAVAVH